MNSLLIVSVFLERANAYVVSFEMHKKHRGICQNSQNITNEYTINIYSFSEFFVCSRYTALFITH